MRNMAFRIAYWVTSAFFALSAVPLMLLPSRRPMMAWILLYTRMMRLWLAVIAGVRVKIVGREKVPAGQCVIAAKHQSWGDGIVMFSLFYDLAFVTGDHLEKFPLLGGIIRKMGAIVVDNCGGATARARLVDTELRKAQEDGRRILIYPEGHLAPVGERYRYKKGVFHMYAAAGCPATPVATNLGVYWPQQDWRLVPGEAVIEFLDPIPPGLDKETFMARLEDAIERRSLELIGRTAPDVLHAPLPDPKPHRRNMAGPDEIAGASRP